MSKFDEIDAQILSSIGTEPKSFSDIYFGAGHGTAEIHLVCKTLTDDKGEPARVLDRRLQALRKKGKIKYVKGWLKIPETSGE